MAHIKKIDEMQINEHYTSPTADKFLNNKGNLKAHVEDVCYGRDDLLEVAERMSNEYGNPSVGEELCGVMADAAVKFLSKIRLNPSWDAANN